MGFQPKPPEKGEKWSAEVNLIVRDASGDVVFDNGVKWPKINPKKVGLIEDILAKALVEFKKLASSV